MSKVQLQGNASGTGIFTIASPNSNTDRTLTLPDNTGTVLTTGSSASSIPGNGNLTEVDIWRLTTDYTNSAGNFAITSNLARASGRGAGSVGTGMTQSSGVFTFPSTGYWLITFVGNFTSTIDNFYAGGLIYSTTDNSSYNVVADAYTAIVTGGSTKYGATCCFFLFNVTSTSLCKVKFFIDSNTNMPVRGNANYNQTHMVFQKVSS